MTGSARKIEVTHLGNQARLPDTDGKLQESGRFVSIPSLTNQKNVWEIHTQDTASIWLLGNCVVELLDLEDAIQRGPTVRSGKLWQACGHSWPEPAL